MSVGLIAKYKNGYNYKENPYPDNQVGVWEVRGEDTNCDFGGSHHRPYIGTFSGTFIDVVSMAVEMPQFWTWGRGGEIKLVTVKKIDSAVTAKRKKLQEELQSIELRAAEIKKQLNS